jgi:hypothetical protein
VIAAELAKRGFVNVRGAVFSASSRSAARAWARFVMASEAALRIPLVIVVPR